MNTDDRNKQIEDDFFEGWMSYAKLHQKYGLSITALQRVINVAKAAGRSRGPKPRSGKPDRRSLDARRSLSPVHLNIGMHVLRYRTNRDWKQTQMGEHIRLSRTKVGELEAGSYDPTIGQIQYIADQIGVSFEDLITPRQIATVRQA